MKRLIFLFLLGPFGQANAQVSSGQVYLLAEKLLDDCTVEKRCDCCVSELIFLSGKVFVLIDHCVPEDSYWTGTYLVKQNKLILRFKQVEVTETYDFEKKQNQIERVNKKIGPIEFEIGSCGQGKVILKNYKIESMGYGERSSSENSVEVLAQYKKTPPWKLLMK